VATIADHVVVLYAGEVVEQGPTGQVFAPPYHPYSRLLLSSVPAMRQGWLEKVLQTRIVKSAIGGIVSSVRVGCPFFDRCPLAIPGTCEKQRPPKLDLSNNHKIFCHREVELLMDSIL
jgi:peptide/nickel transport system ATP-binding protein